MKASRPSPVEWQRTSVLCRDPTTSGSSAPGVVLILRRGRPGPRGVWAQVGSPRAPPGRSQLAGWWGSRRTPSRWAPGPSPGLRVQSWVSGLKGSGPTPGHRVSVLAAGSTLGRQVPVRGFDFQPDPETFGVWGSLRSPAGEVCEYPCDPSGSAPPVALFVSGEGPPSETGPSSDAVVQPRGLRWVRALPWSEGFTLSSSPRKKEVDGLHDSPVQRPG